MSGKNWQTLACSMRRNKEGKLHMNSMYKVNITNINKINKILQKYQRIKISFLITLKSLISTITIYRRTTLFTNMVKIIGALISVSKKLVNFITNNKKEVSLITQMMKPTQHQMNKTDH
jgi:hypothetical protein